MKRSILLLIILSVIACAKKQEAEFSSRNYIPNDSEAIIITPDLKQLLANINSNNFLNESKFDLKNRLSTSLEFVDHLNFKTETTISFSKISSETLIYTIATKKDSGFIMLDSIQNKSMETIKEGGVDFKRITIEDNKFFLYETSATSIISNSKKKIQEIANSTNLLKSDIFLNAFTAADPNKTSVFLKKSVFRETADLFANFHFPGFKNFASWSLLELEVTNLEIRLNGISITDATASFLNNFQGIDPKEIEIGKVCPQDFLNFYSIAFSSFERLSNNIQKESKDSISYEFPEILNYVREAASVKLKEGELFVLNATELELAKENLAGMGEEIESYRANPIFELSDPGIFETSLAPIITINKTRFYTVLDHFIVFSDDLESLKKTISDYQNSNTIGSKIYYSEMMSSLSSESSILMVARLPEFYSSIDKQNKSEKLNFKKNSLAALQIISEDNFAHIHGVLTNAESEITNGNSGAEQIASFKLDSPVATNPYFFKNHETDQMDLAIQDEENLLYLISNKGTVFWKKQLDSKIGSEIYEVDLFKNGNKQLAFSTGYHLEILDRNGNSVKPFPVTFNEALTQPLSVFDYDNNRTYRFVLTQGKRVYMLGPKGKSIKGFDFENAKTTISKVPKHIRLGNKDYILIAEESGRLNILSRQGSIRVPVNEDFNYSENEWYGNDDKFLTSEPSSNLIAVTQSGAVSRTNLELADNHRLVATDDLLVYLNENQLTINDQVINLDFGLYTDPQLFKIGKRSYIAITDTQAQKVYVFNEEAELLPGFPVFGTSPVDIANADLDSRLELLVKGDDSEVLLYKL